MYTELIQFAKQNNLYLKPNRTTVKLRSYIKLDSNGEYLGVVINETIGDKAVTVPDFGSARFLQYQANAIVDYVGVIFRYITPEKDYTKKSDSYLEEIHRGAKFCKSLRVIEMFLNNYWHSLDLQAQVISDLNAYKIKANEYLSYIIDGVFVETMEDDWSDWLNQRCQELTPKLKCDIYVISSVSGMLQKTKIKNLPSVSNIEDNLVKGRFGLGRTGYFAAADKNAYESYGLKGSLSFNIGIEDTALLVAGIEKLLNDKHHHSLDFKLLYFYTNPDMVDILGESLNLSNSKLKCIGVFDDDECDTGEECSDIDSDVLSKFMTEILTAIWTGQSVYIPESYRNVSCYMFGFDTLAGRCFMSNEHWISCYDLMCHLVTWYEDTQVFNGRSYCFLYNLNNVLCNCVSNLDGDISKQIKNEFSDLKYQLLNAVYFGKQIPELFYQRALIHASLTFVRRREVSVKNGGLEKIRSTNISMIYVQIIKCYLRRKGYYVMDELTQSAQVNKAYLCGRLFAVYEELQYLYAEKKLNKNLAQSFFRSAMKQPGVIFPKLSEMAIVYLNGMKSISLKNSFHEKLGEISGLIGTEFPKSFNLDEQGSFVLGYYQQKNDTLKQIREYKESKQGDINGLSETENNTMESEDA